MEFNELVVLAKEVVLPRKLSEGASCGTVGAALESTNGEVFRGICVDTTSSCGFCAEHAAAATMLTAGHNVVVKMVAVNEAGQIYPPCGRCREFISLLSPDNRFCEVLVANDTVVTLEELRQTGGPKADPWAPSEIQDQRERLVDDHALGSVDDGVWGAGKNAVTSPKPRGPC